MNIPFSLEGKTALITGAASGIGEATARELSEAGAEVWIADINLDAATRLAGSLNNAKAVLLDVTSQPSVQAALKSIPRLDILVNNAGIGLVGDILATSEADFARVMLVNTHSVFLVTQAALPLLLESHGSIVNIGSVAGLVGIKQRFAYCASKGAVIRHDPPARRRVSEAVARQLHRTRVPCSHRSSKAISRSITRTKRKKSAKN